MAADPQPDWLCSLPSVWSYGVTRDGRIFFINEEAKSTSWSHPVSGEAVITGHRKTPDLPTGWEEGYTFEGARCFINHNERKVTCKHPVSGVPSQDNCIFVVNEQAASKASAEQESSSDKKERPMSIMSEASNYTGGSDYSTFPASPATTTSSSTRPSRSSKKVHNFGKRSNSIKRNSNAPVVKRNWLYKQDSTGMKSWKKRWFVSSDMCSFYYRDEKEDSISGSISSPSFHISMSSVDDHISKKYAFKATHPNMRTYYFCTDTAKEMESWMKVMTDAALVHTEPVKRLDKSNVDQQTPQQWNNLLNHAVLRQPEIQNNERNREPVRQHSLSRADDKRLKDTEKQNSQKEREYYTSQRDGEKFSSKKDGVSYMLQKDGDRYLLHKDGERYSSRRDGEKYSLHKEENYAVQKVNNKYTVTPTEEKYAPSKDGEKFLLTKDGEKYASQKVGDRHMLQKDGHNYVPQKEIKRQLSLKETESYSTMRDKGNNYGTVQIVDKYGNSKEVRKYSTLREGNKYAALTNAEKYATIRAGEKYCFQRDASSERCLNKINSIKLQPTQAAAIAAAVSASRQNQASLNAQNPSQVHRHGEPPGDCGQRKVDNMGASVPSQSRGPVPEPGGGLPVTSPIQQVEPRVRTQRPRESDDDTRSVMSYQTLPRNMPSHRAQIAPCYPEGYRTSPRNSMMRPDSICSVAGSVYDRASRPVSTSTISSVEKRRSMRDDTMWQSYEWQQRQAFSRQSLAQPAAVGHYGTLPSTKTMGNISEHAVARSIATSPSHGSSALYSTFSPPQQQVPPNPSSSLAEASSPDLRADGTLDRRQRSHLTKYECPSDRRSIATCVPPQTITPQSSQGKTPEELTLSLIKLRRQQAEINSSREHTVAQLMASGIEGPNAKINPEEFKDSSLRASSDKADVEIKSSRLCEKDKVSRMQEEKSQQSHREKHTSETVSQSASQESGEQSTSNTVATQSSIQQRDVSQSGSSSTCRESSRVTAESERSWKEYEQSEVDVTSARTNSLEQSEASGSPQTEPPSQQHIQIQKELWRIQDVMEALSRKNPQQRTETGGFPGAKPLSSEQKNEALSPPSRPPLPHCYDSSERIPHIPPHHSQPRSRPLHVHRPEERKPGSRNGAHSQAPDYRSYKSEPELTTVKEEGDEANAEDKDRTEKSAESKDTPASKVPPFPVGVVAPRTKSPMSPPESSTIASYVTSRKTKKPDSRCVAGALKHSTDSSPVQDRPRSASDQVGFGEREFIRTRMSVEEQSERMRRNQEASSLREKRRETSSRSSSFSKDNPLLHVQSRAQSEGACSDPMELQTALSQIEVAQKEQSLVTSGANSAEEPPTSPQIVQINECVKDSQHEEMKQEKSKILSMENQPPVETSSELCESQRVVIVDSGTDSKRVEIVNFQPYEDDQSKGQDVTSSPTNNITEYSFQTPNPEPKEPETDGRQNPCQEEHHGKNIDSYKQSTEASTKHNISSNMMAVQTFTLVSSDT